MGRRGRGDCNMGGPGGLQEVTYAVPADKCGLVIGKGKEHSFTRLLVHVNVCFQHPIEPVLVSLVKTLCDKSPLINCRKLN